MKNQQTLILAPIQETGGRNTEPELSIFVIYDDTLNGSEARKFLEGIVSTQVELSTVHVDEISIAELANPTLFLEALELATHCHLLVVATRDPSQLSPDRQAWLGDFMKQAAANEGAFVLLTGQPGLLSDQPSSIPMIRKLASSHGIPFFSKVIPMPDVDPVQNSSKRHPPALARLPYYARPEGWGINE